MVTRTAGARIGCQRPSRFWGLGCPKIYHEAEDTLENSRWCLLKRKENLTEKQEIKLKEILKYNLRSVRAYLLKEDFNGFWEYVSPAWAEKFLDRWCTRVMRSQIEPMKKVAKTIRAHKLLILNWFKAKKALLMAIYSDPPTANNFDPP